MIFDIELFGCFGLRCRHFCRMDGMTLVSCSCKLHITQYIINCKWVRNLLALQSLRHQFATFTLSQKNQNGEKKRAKATAAEDKTGNKPEKKNLCLWHRGVRSLNTANKGTNPESPDHCPQCVSLLPLSG